MSYGVRVSKVQVQKVLEKYFDDAMVMRVLGEICYADECDHRNMIGMTYGQWKERFDYDHDILWADDTNAGFGNAGDPVYGDCDDCVICRTEYDGKRYKLFVWCEPLHSDLDYVYAAMRTNELRTISVQ